MNIPAHLVSGYVVYWLVWGADNKYLAPFLVATVAIDVDHLFTLKRNLQRKPLKFDSFWRTRFHELYGLAFFSIIFLGLWFLEPKLSIVLALGFFLHFVVDFLTGETRPFYPFSQAKVQIFFKKNVWLRYILEWTCLIIVIIYLVKYH